MKRSEDILDLVALCRLLLVGAALSSPEQLAATPPPMQFKAVDTSAIMGSPDPMPLEVERVFNDLMFERPLELTYAEDNSNRVFVVEQGGRIHVFPNEIGVGESEIFLDISEVVSREGNEEGLLGLAFHPDYRENGQFFVYYSTIPQGARISRFHVSQEDPNRALRKSEEEIMRIEQPFRNHNGGSIKFGPDGYLYIGLGDGGSAHDPHRHGQNLETLLGAILRIDIDRKEQGKAYAVPKDNPFVDHGATVRSEIWAYGLRNVWRLAFDRTTGALWAGDVGQHRYEEVNLITRGGNYGWNVREGFHPFEPDAPQIGTELIDPLAEYFHSEGLSITGGLVYRGKRMPSYEGAYFYADYVTGQVWMLRWDGERVTQNRKVADTGLAISAFGEDAAGEMYFTAFDGKIYRFRQRAIEPEAVHKAFPQKLSDTGLFTSLKELKPVPGLIPYDVNVPLWSDHAEKERLLGLRAKGSVHFDSHQTWAFPIGTTFVKHFRLDLDRTRPSGQRLLETRLLVHSEEGWRGYTYVWNDEQTDAKLADNAFTKTFKVRTGDGVIDQRWYFPSRTDCIACHANSVNFVLGANTRQMNRNYGYRNGTANQIDALDQMGVFAGPRPARSEDLETFPTWESSNTSSEMLARAYLDVHCAACHGPGGILGHRPNFRFHAKPKEMAAIGRKPRQGWVGPEDSTLIEPGDSSRSEVLSRMIIRGDRQMPPLGTNLVDEAGVDLIRKWIQRQGAPVR